MLRLDRNLLLDLRKCLLLFGRALRNDFSPIQYDDPVTQNLDIFHIMCRVTDCRAIIPQLPDTIQNVVPALRIDCNGRLI